MSKAFSEAMMWQMCAQDVPGRKCGRVERRKPHGLKNVFGGITAIKRKRQLMLHEASTWLLSNTIRRLFDGTILKGEFEEKAEILEIPSHDPPFITAVVKVEAMLNGETDDVGTFAAENILKEMLAGKGAVAQYNSRIVAAYATDADENMVDRLTERLEHLKKYMIEEFGYRTCYAIGPVCSSIDNISFTVALEGVGMNDNSGKFSHPVQKALEFIEREYHKPITL